MLERIFRLKENGTAVRTEVLAGFTTFLTMAYIILVNPTILADAGMPAAGAAAATCLAAAFGSICMGLFANYPIALAPGMGLNAYFTYTVVKGMGLPWETALGCVFLSGVAFLLLTVAGVRRLIVGAIPRDLFAAIAAGIGLFIAFIGLRSAGLVVAHPATTVALGDLTAPAAALAVFGLAVTAALLAWRVKAAMLIGILATTALAWILGLVDFRPAPYNVAELTATAFKLDVPAALGLGGGGLTLALVEILFVFLFVDLFDNVGTLVAVSKRAGIVDPETGEIPQLHRERRGRFRRGPHGPDRGRCRSAVPGRDGVRALRPGHPARRHGPGPDPGRRHDDGAAGGERLDRSDGGRPRLPDPDRHPADLLDRQRPGFRHHRPCGAQAGPGPGPTSRLAGVPAGGLVRGPLRLARGGVALGADFR